MTARERVMGAVELTGCGYVDASTVTARCPVCHGQMAVRFVGDQRARFTCTGERCRESQIAAELFGLVEVDERDERIADFEARVGRLTWAVDFLRDLAFESCPFCDDGRVIA